MFVLQFLGTMKPKALHSLFLYSGRRTLKPSHFPKTLELGGETETIRIQTWTPRKPYMGPHPGGWGGVPPGTVGETRSNTHSEEGAGLEQTVVPDQGDSSAAQEMGHNHI